VDSDLLAKLKQWLMQNAGVGGSQGNGQPQGADSGASPWAGMPAGDNNATASSTPNAQVMQDSMRKAFGYSK
jgi:hypothetical protein